jgi:uncharacterized protein (UPF0248 family)
MEEELIECVRQHPAIWQISLRSYRDSRVKENAWKEVARYLDTSVKLAMNKWKNTTQEKQQKKVVIGIHRPSCTRVRDLARDSRPALTRSVGDIVNRLTSMSTS